MKFISILGYKLRWHNVMEESSMRDLDGFPKWDIVTNTTTKAKYLFALVRAKEGICVKKFVIKLGVV